MRRIILLALLGLSGCASYGVASPSTPGKAYVIVGGVFSQKMYLCDATSGKPICKEQVEQ